MRSRLMRITALAVATTLFSTGCFLSRAVDRAFIGITARRPTYADRKATGVFLVPFTFAIDLVTFPLQALLVVLLGDGFPFYDKPQSVSDTVTLLEKDHRFQQLSDEQKATALADLRALFEGGALDANSALVLTEDGHVVVTQLEPEAKQQLLARLGQPQPAPVCQR
jgi:hypothetical protein